MKRYAAIVSVGLLVGDVILPVPASGVMFANGHCSAVWPGRL
jgi:hypothetical protein